MITEKSANDEQRFLRTGTQISPIVRSTTHKQFHFPDRVKIHYFLHPLYQQEVKVLDKRNFVTEKYYLIEFFEKTVFLPVWMTDPDYCSTLTISENPISSKSLERKTSNCTGES